MAINRIFIRSFSKSKYDYEYPQDLFMNPKIGIKRDLLSKCLEHVPQLGFTADAIIKGLGSEAEVSEVELIEYYLDINYFQHHI